MHIKTNTKPDRHIHRQTDRQTDISIYHLTSLYSYTPETERERERERERETRTHTQTQPHTHRHTPTNTARERFYFMKQNS